ncbi:MAG: DUF188 domain-containing protein [Acinetobacter sp.]|nr:DUF188 domain-containing protein [Acinetobacter sp.]
MMTLWVDADAVPRIWRELILRASDRYHLAVRFVANSALGIAPSQRVQAIQVLKQADEADHYIVQHLQPHDIVITDDIPFAVQVVERGGVVLRFRGDVINKDNAKARLHTRDYMAMLRESGVIDTHGLTASLSERDKREFSGALDRLIQQQLRKRA